MGADRSPTPAALCADNLTLAEMERYQVWNRAAVPVVAAAGVPVLRIWRSSALSWDEHVGGGDCTHWCLPGLPDAWAPQLYRELTDAFARPAHRNEFKAASGNWWRPRAD